jgi:hypothetical protein
LAFDFNRAAVEFLFKKRLTVEVTWGETATTQPERNHATPKQSRCFALTSSEVLDASQSLARRRPSRNFARNVERLGLVFKQAVLCVFKHEASNGCLDAGETARK